MVDKIQFIENNNDVVYDSMRKRWGNSYSTFQTKLEASNFLKRMINELAKLDIYNERGMTMYNTLKGITLLDDDFVLDSSLFTPTGNIFMLNEYNKIAKKYITEKDENIKSSFLYNYFVKETYEPIKAKFEEALTYAIFLDNDNFIKQYIPEFISSTDLTKKMNILSETIINFYDDNSIKYSIKSKEELKKFIVNVLENEENKKYILESTKNKSLSYTNKLIKNLLIDKIFFFFYPDIQSNSKFYLFENEEKSIVNKNYINKYTKYKKAIIEAYDNIKVKQYESRLRNNALLQKKIAKLNSDEKDVWIKTMANSYYFYKDKKKLSDKEAEKRAAATAWKVVKSK